MGKRGSLFTLPPQAKFSTDLIAQNDSLKQVPVNIEEENKAYFHKRSQSVQERKQRKYENNLLHTNVSANNKILNPKKCKKLSHSSNLEQLAGISIRKQVSSPKSSRISNRISHRKRNSKTCETLCRVSSKEEEPPFLSDDDESSHLDIEIKIQERILERLEASLILLAEE